MSLRHIALAIDSLGATHRERAAALGLSLRSFMRHRRRGFATLDIQRIAIHPTVCLALYNDALDTLRHLSVHASGVPEMTHRATAFDHPTTHLDMVQDAIP